MAENSFVELVQGNMGPPAKVDQGELDKIGDDAALNIQIVELARAGVPYPVMADQLGMSLSKLLARINQMISGGNDVLSKQQMNDYLLYQLGLIQMGIENSLEDMQVRPTGDPVEDKVIFSARDKGRVGLHKFLQHQAAIMQLFRQQIDIREVRKVEISVVRPEDFDAL
jgi:hypothetical protein